jgi:hypothetical protein
MRYITQTFEHGLRIHNALVDRALDPGSRPIGSVREKAAE